MLPAHRVLHFFAYPVFFVTEKNFVAGLFLDIRRSLSDCAFVRLNVLWLMMLEFANEKRARCVCVCVFVCVCVYVFVCACVCLCVDVGAGVGVGV